MEYTLCFPVWRSVFDQTRGEGTALSLVASVRYNPREGFSSKTTAGSGRFASKSDSTKSDFSKFRFSPPPRIARSHPSVFPLLLLPHRFPRKLRMKSGERIVSGSVFLLFFFSLPCIKHCPIITKQVIPSYSSPGKKGEDPNSIDLIELS